MSLPMAMPRMTLHRLRLASRLESRTEPRVSPASRPNCGPREESWPDTGAEGTTDIPKKVLEARGRRKTLLAGVPMKKNFGKIFFLPLGWRDEE